MRITEWQPRHARLLADLWNASDAAWPSGLVHLRPKTPAEALEWERRTDAFVRFLAMDGRRPIGYASLREWWSSPDGTYVQWLNVDPRYHGKGVGKALLLKTIERTIELGYAREDLHTWPGNDKAMPLYKRTGFMWVPGSHAYLQNYIPLLLTYAPAKRFFARHDWYTTLRRDLKRDLDEDRLHGIDVFVYRFRAGRDRLEAAVDRNARGLMAFEDRALRVEAWVEKGTLVRGQPGTMHWFVRNKTRSEVDVRLESRAPQGVAVAKVAAFRLRPGGQKEVRGTVSVPPRFKDPPSGWTSPYVETRVFVAGRSIRLRSGFRAKTAVDFAWEQDAPRLPSPGSKDLRLVVRNQCGKPLQGRLTVKARGLRIKPSRVAVRLPKVGARRLSIRVENPTTESRAASVRLRFAAGAAHVEKNLPLPCLAPGGGLAYRREGEFVLQTPAMQFVSSSVGAEGSLRLPDGASILRSFIVVAGPPYWPMDAMKSPWKGRIGGSREPEIVRTFGSNRRPGLLLEQRWRLLGERTLELRMAVENRGSAPWSVGLMALCERGDEPGVVTIPTKEGPLSEAVMESEWPDQRNDVPLDRLLNEGWLHVGGGRGGYGLVWEPSEGKKDGRIELTAWDLPLWITPEVRLRPKGRHEFRRLWIRACDDWREMRDFWSDVTGEERKPDLPKIGSLRMEVRPALVLASPSAEIATAIRNLRMRPMDGVLHLETATRMAASRTRWAVRGLQLGSEWTRALRVRGKGPHAGALRFHFENPYTTHRWEVPAVASDGRGRIQVSGSREQRVLSNGLLTFTASATHAGALTSLRAGRHEYLVSSYPKPSSFTWFRPFYGGIYPSLYSEDWPGSLYKERFRLGVAQRGTWTGVALSARAKESDLPKGTEVRLEYLTRPGSPLLAMTLGVRNRTRERQRFTAGFWAFLGLDRRPNCEVEFERLLARQWRRAPWARWTVVDGGFAVFHSPRAPRAVALCAASPAEAEVFDLRDNGCHGLVQRQLDLAPGKEATVLATLVLVPPDQAAAYRVLRGLTPTSFEATHPR